MKQLITVLFFALLISFKVFAQSNNKVTTFHRMLIFKDNKELLIVKLKNHDLWVTPGLYQNNEQTIKQGIDSIATTYGIKISEIQLRGVYGLIIPSRSTYSTRNIFTMKTKNEVNRLPNNIEEFKWVEIKEAVKLINIPHINDLILDVFNNPKSVRAGTVEMKFIDNKRTSEIIEKFYSIN